MIAMRAFVAFAAPPRAILAPYAVRIMPCFFAVWPCLSGDAVITATQSLLGGLLQQQTATATDY